MNREERLQLLFAQFDKSAKQFSEDTKAVFCDISSVYKKEETPEDLKLRTAKIYYNSFIVKFVYTAHGMMSVVNSILECRVCFDKIKESMEIPLPMVTDYCDIDIASPLCIPFITNDGGMQQAFDSIGNTVKSLLPLFSDISYDPVYKEKIVSAFEKEVSSIFKMEMDSETSEVYGEILYNFFRTRFTGEAFINYINGNCPKAVKQLGKIKNPTGYEKRVMRLWSDEKKTETSALSMIEENAEKYNEIGVPKANLKEFTSLFVSWILLTPIPSAIYIGIYFLLFWIEGRDSVYLMGPMYNLPFCILGGFITAIATSYFTRFRFYKWLFKKDYEKYCEMDHIQNGGGSDRLMKGFFVVLVIVSILGCGLFERWNLNFLADGFVDNSTFLSLQGDYHAYSEVERVYYKPDRVNDFDVTLEIPSYVLVLKDGTEIDFYDLDDVSNYEVVLLDHLRDNGIKIENEPVKE